MPLGQGWFVSALAPRRDRMLCEYGLAGLRKLVRNAQIERHARCGREGGSGGGVVGEEEVPGVVEVEPARSAEPAGGQAGDVQQGVAAEADHLGTIPAAEGAGGETH